MNHSVAQPCRVLRFAQAATFTAQFLNDTSVTSVLANDDVLKLLKLGLLTPSSALHFARECSTLQNNAVSFLEHQFYMEI